MCHLVDVVVGTSSQFDALFFSDTHFFFIVLFAVIRGGAAMTMMCFYLHGGLCFLFLFLCVSNYSQLYYIKISLTNSAVMLPALIMGTPIILSYPKTWKFIQLAMTSTPCRL